MMGRIRAVYRGRGIAVRAKNFWRPSSRRMARAVGGSGLRRRHERLYQQLDQLQPLRPEAQRELIEESRRHPANRSLSRSLGRFDTRRTADRRVQTPHRFRTKRQLWAYGGLAVETRSSADYRFADGQLQRPQVKTVRGLNDNHNHS